MSTIDRGRRQIAREHDLEMHNAQLEVWAAACERAARDHRHPGNVRDYHASENHARKMDAIAEYLRSNKLNK